MGKGSELLQMLKTGNTEQARRLAAKLKKQGKKKYTAALNDQDEDGYTPLHYAAAYNFLDFLEEFIESGATIDVGDQKGATPLHLAALNGRLEATRILLHRGADPNIAARSGDTPLHLGSLNGHADVVEALVREHSKCAMLNVSGQTSLDLACQNGHASVVGILLRSGQFSQSYLQHSDIPQTAMKLAAKHGHTEVLNLLVKHGFDVNKLLPSAHGTCLHEAALYGKVDTVQFLLQCGADPSVTNSQGLTPLDIVNQYTDPRSANQLKLILQEGLANQARARIANHHQQQQHRPQSYSPQAQPQQQQLPYERSHSLSRSQAQTTPQTQPQATQPAHIQQQQAYHQAYQQAFYAQHRQQRSSLTSATAAAQPQTQQPAAQAYTQAYAQQQQSYTQQQQQAAYAQQQQAYAQQQAAYVQQQAAYTQQQGYAQPAATTAQPPPSPSITAKGGGGVDFASMIAAKAALRKQTSTESPEFGEEGGIVRSSTMSSGSRMQRPQSQKRERRSSLTDESIPATNDYAGNAPTLPRRSNQGPPSFKPGPPPPDTLSHSSSSSSIGAAPPPLRKLEKPRPSPPPATIENELLAKLRRRQQTIEDEKVAAPSEEPPKPEESHTSPPPPPPPREDSVPPPQAEPPKVASKPPPPKPKPKPVKEDSPKPSWQEEVARRKAERKQKEEQEEKEEAEKLEKERLERERQDKEREEKERAEKERLEAEEQERQRLEREKEERERLERERIERERLESERIESERIEKERLEAEKRERMERQQAEQQRMERERMEREQQERQRLDQEAELKRRSTASLGTPERQVPPPVKAKPHAQPPPPPPPVVVEDNRMPIMTSDEESLPSTTPASEMFESTSMNSLVGAAAVGSTSNMHSQAAFECIPIADWLMSYKLSEYVTLFENNGYDNTDFLLGISVDELTELGVGKPGHRRRMMAALNQLLPKEHFLTIKPASVGEWLMQLGLNRYEEVMMESGYDDIDFVSSVTEEELTDIGISKKGHLKRFRKGVQELMDMQKSEPATPSPFTQPFNQLNIQSSPSQSMSNLSASSQNYDQTSRRDSIAVSEGDVLLEPSSAGGSPGKVDPSEGRPRAGSSERPPPVATRPSRSSRHEKLEETPTPTELTTTCSQDSGIESMGAPGHRQGNNFSKMKTMLEQRMGIREDGGSEEEESTPPPHPVEAPRPSSPKPHGKAVPPPPIPKRASSNNLSAGGREVSPLLQSHHQTHHEDTDYVNEIPPPVPQHRNSRTEQYTTADVAAVDMVGSSPSSTEGTPVRSVPAGGELDELDRVLMGFDSGPSTTRPPLPKKASIDGGEGEEQTDQLLADIDNMLADLNTHLDIMIPGSDV